MSLLLLLLGLWEIRRFLSFFFSGRGRVLVAAFRGFPFFREVMYEFSLSMRRYGRFSAALARQVYCVCCARVLRLRDWKFITVFIWVQQQVVYWGIKPKKTRRVLGSVIDRRN
jgi:hypothetical protein